MTVNIHKFAEQFGKEYDFLYNARGIVAGESEAVDEFDRLLNSSEQFRNFVGEFAAFRHDFISSDREAAAFMFALDAMTA